MEAYSLNPDARQFLDDYVKQMVRRQWRTVCATLVAAGVLNVGALWVVWQTAAEKAKDAAVKEATARIEGESARFRNGIEESYRLTIDQTRDLLKSLSQDFAESFRKVGEVQVETRRIRGDLDGLRDGLGAVRTSMDAVNRDVEAASRDASRKAEDMTKKAEGLLAELDNRGKQLSTVATKLAELEKATSHLSQDVMVDGIAKLTAFRRLLSEAGDAKKLVELEQTVTGLRSRVDPVTGLVNCSMLILSDPTGVRLGEFRRGERGGAVLLLRSAAGKELVTAEASADVGLVYCSNSQGKTAIAIGGRNGAGGLSVNAGDGTVRMNVTAGSSEGTVETYNGSLQTLVRLGGTSTSAAGQVATYANGQLMTALSTGDAGNAGLWIYRPGQTQHVATLQDHPDGSVVTLFNPKTTRVWSMGVQH